MEAGALGAAGRNVGDINVWTLWGGEPGAAVLSEAFERVNMSLALFPAG